MPEPHDQQAERAYKAAVKKSLQQNQRALKIGGGRGTFTADEWLGLCEDHGNRCVLCGYAQPLTPDHVVPLMSGGSNFIRNIQPLCHPCNIIKRGTAMDYRINDTLRPGGPTVTSPVKTHTEPAPRPIWRAELLSIQLLLDERCLPKPGHAAVQEHLEQTENDDIVPVLLAEIRRLRNLVLANETLAHLESVAWWYRDSLPCALREYLNRQRLII